MPESILPLSFSDTDGVAVLEEEGGPSSHLLPD